MNQVDLQSNNDSRRREIRITNIPLQVELRKSRPFNLGKFHLCTFVDINIGGIGLFSDNLSLRVLDRVNLRVYHELRSYFIRGIIGYRQEINGGVQYGIIFVEVPGELDLLIKKAMDKEQPSDADSAVLTDKHSGATLIPGGQRRIDVRRTTPLLAIEVRKLAVSSSRYYQANMIDISSQGIGFVADQFQCELMSEVELALGYGDSTYRATGIVCYNGKTADGNCYGVEFKQIEPELLSILTAKYRA